MLTPRLRTVLATAVLAASALPGLGMVAGSASAADTVVGTDPGGGCWRYVPAVLTPEVPRLGTPLSTELEPWVLAPAEAEVQLSTAGDTAVGGTRTFALEIPNGPVLYPDATEQPAEKIVLKASAVLLLDGAELPPVTTEVELEPAPAAPDPAAAAPVTVPALSFTGEITIATAATSALILKQLTVDVPRPDLPQSPSLRVVCNGQTEGDPGTLPGLGVNPATEPVATSVTATYRTVAGTAAKVTAISSQAVTNAARAGDTLTLQGSGFPSAAAGALEMCDPDGTTACTQMVPTQTTPTGEHLASAALPSGLAAGDRAVRLVAGLRSATTPLLVLGDPTAEASSEGSGEDRAAQVAGGDWDPLRKVALRGLDSSGAAIGKRIVVTADERGRIEGRLDVGKRAVTAVRAEQKRAGGDLVVEADLDGGEVTGGPETPQQDAPGDATPPASGAPVTTTGPVTADPVTAAPVEIPEPADLAVNEVTAPGDAAAAQQGELAIIDAALTGSSTLGDMFGASPRRVLRLDVENVGQVAVSAPGLTISVGRTDDVEPIYSSDGLGTIEPGAVERIEVPIALGVGAIGTYQISGQLGTGEAGTFSLTWQTYPWGLIVLNVLGIALLSWAVERRLRRRNAPRVVAALAPAGLAPGAPVAGGPVGGGEAVIDLETLERWWAMQAAAPETLIGAGDDGHAVVDIDAVERWIDRLPARS
ncbi:hypothetical protein KG112_01225 [Nocardioides sp. zg-ZUI104]|uniref:hypothetical protein n=1 Tax=Nocardioides faecalis TaxID=2803858 RepID=UPI001BCC9AFC|nr:hypothetical protein [Nocardioides faecalis]MBS4751425.1 hypothetical protein [Nocardioides faecalis]